MTDLTPVRHTDCAAEDQAAEITDGRGNISSRINSLIKTPLVNHANRDCWGVKILAHMVLLNCRANRSLRQTGN